jgi:hypothetical protein
MIFPHVFADGTFIVRLRFTSKEHIARRLVDDWITSWHKENDPWERCWRGAGGRVSRIEVMRFKDSFLGLPKCVSAQKTQVIIAMEGISNSSFWKDWMVKFIVDISKDLGLAFVCADDSCSRDPGISP